MTACLSLFAGWLWLLLGLQNLLGAAEPPVNQTAPAEAAVGEVRLESSYLASPLHLTGASAYRAIRSVRIIGNVPSQGDGSGEIWFDSREAELNSFGDVTRRTGAEPVPVRIQLHFAALGVGPSTNQAAAREESPASQGFKLYDLVFPGGMLAGRLQLVLGTASLGPHRLLVYESTRSNPPLRASGLQHILPLQGVPAITSALPDVPLGRADDLTGYYTTPDGPIRRLELRSRPGGKGHLTFDPNTIGFDRFGEPVLSTAMGYQPREITLQLAPEPDPLGQERRLYRAVQNDAKDTNRVAVVLGRTEASAHRVVLNRGGQVSSVVPVYLAARRQQEVQATADASLSPGEQEAIQALRWAIGYDFRLQIENKHAVELYAAINSDRILPTGLLARLPHLRSIEFSGEHSPGALLSDLSSLVELKTLGFSGVACSADDLAALQNLSGLEALNFYVCRGISDEGVRQLAKLTALTRLRLYNEEDLRHPSKTSERITDAGLAHLSQLVRLQYLDLFGHRLSDASVPVLVRMTELEELALSGRGFTDAGLRGLGRLSKLRHLRLFETAVTTNGVAGMKKQLPELQIEAWNGDGHD